MFFVLGSIKQTYIIRIVSQERSLVLKEALIPQGRLMPNITLFQGYLLGEVIRHKAIIRSLMVFMGRS